MAKSSQCTKRIQKLRLKEGIQLEAYSPLLKLADDKFIGAVIIDCLKNNDPDGVLEAIEAHVDALIKLNTSSQAEIPKIQFSKNPTLRTLARTIHAISSKVKNQ